MINSSEDISRINWIYLWQTKATHLTCIKNLFLSKMAQLSSSVRRTLALTSCVQLCLHMSPHTPRPPAYSEGLPDAAHLTAWSSIPLRVFEQASFSLLGPGFSIFPITYVDFLVALWLTLGWPFISPACFHLPLHSSVFHTTFLKALWVSWHISV